MYRFGHVHKYKKERSTDRYNNNMSTRAHIGFFEKEPTEAKRTKPEVLIYKHSDGYPEGTLPQLTEFCRTFNEHRGLRDTEYATARCVQFMTNFDDGEMAKWYKETQGTDDKRWSFLGYGVGTGFHGDVEYYYLVTPEEIKVYEVGNDLRLVQTIEL